MSAALGIDLGERRIGVALAEDGALSARPLTTIPRGRAITADIVALRALIDRHGVAEVVVGLPLEARGDVGPQANHTLAWVDQLRAGLDRDVVITMRDERLTSHVAESRLGPMGRGRSGGPPSRTQRDRYRAKVDREAAAIILQDVLDTRRGADASPVQPPTDRETPE